MGLVHTCLYLSAPAAEGLLKLTAVGVTFFQRPEKSPVPGSVCVWGEKKNQQKQKSNLLVTYNLIK